MKYYKAKIKPTSPFGTNPMSDTIFGQLVWTLSDMGEDLSKLLADYDTSPFLVVSDFLPFNMGNVPKIPTIYKVEGAKNDKINKILERKKIKAKNYISIETLYSTASLNKNKIVELAQALVKFNKSAEIIRCSINRKTGTTGDGFDPYPVYDTFFTDNAEFTFYFYIADESNFGMIQEALELIGKTGFGRDASLGRGQFEVLEFDEIEFSPENKNAIYTLGNVALEGLSVERAYYEPFTRFGRHGNIRAVMGNPFKNPLVMALQGALLFGDNNIFSKPYIGKSIRKLSYYGDTVQQGYSLYIPINVEVQP
ncbi:hypothetical protein DSN97_07275 [Deferribacteraceae bacterium V6Fe1]|nr:hypothetical protein DSN97_07275 [Deferribacteraceae bacterium V6Fe1]